MKTHFKTLIFSITLCLGFSTALFSQLQSIQTPGEPLQINRSVVDLVVSGTQTRFNADSELLFFDQRDKVVRYREIELAKKIMSTQESYKGREFSINLFEDLEFSAVVKRSDVNVNGSVSVTLKLNDFDYAFMLISTTNQRTLANLSVPEENLFFKIISDPHSKKHFVIEIAPDDRDELPPGPVLIPEPVEKEKTEPNRKRYRILFWRNKTN